MFYITELTKIFFSVPAEIHIDHFGKQLLYLLKLTDKIVLDAPHWILDYEG